MEDATLIKLKRQIRDWYNKYTNDRHTLEEVARTVGYKRKENHNEDLYKLFQS